MLRQEYALSTIRSTGADPAIQEGRVKGHCTLLKWVWSMGVATDLQTLL